MSITFKAEIMHLKRQCPFKASFLCQELVPLFPLTIKSSEYNKEEIFSWNSS